MRHVHASFVFSSNIGTIHCRAFLLMAVLCNKKYCPWIRSSITSFSPVNYDNFPAMTTNLNTGARKFL